MRELLQRGDLGRTGLGSFGPVGGGDHLGQRAPRLGRDDDEAQEADQWL